HLKRARQLLKPVCLFAPTPARTAPSSQHYPFALDIPEEPWPGELCRIEPVFDCTGNRLHHDPGVEIRVIGQSSEHHQCFPIVATLVKDQGDISIAIRPVLSACARAKQYRSIQLYISGNPRQEVAYSALGIWIQEFHDHYFG